MERTFTYVFYFNDTYNKRVIRFDHKGKMVKLPYQRSALNLNDSFEAKRAAENYTLAETTDLAKGPNSLSTPEPGADYFDDRAIDDCQSNADYPGSSLEMMELIHVSQTQHLHLIFHYLQVL